MTNYDFNTSYTYIKKFMRVKANLSKLDNFFKKLYSLDKLYNFICGG